MSPNRSLILRENRASKLREEIIRSKMKHQTRQGIPNRLPPLVYDDSLYRKAINQNIDGVSKRKRFIPNHNFTRSLTALSDEKDSESSDNLSSHTFILESTSLKNQDNHENYPKISPKRPSSKIPIKINSTMNVHSIIAQQEAKILSRNQSGLSKLSFKASLKSGKKLKCDAIYGTKEIDVVTINSHGGGVLGLTPGFKINILGEYLSSNPDLIFIQDSIDVDDLKELIDSSSGDKYDYIFDEETKNEAKDREENDLVSITAIIWKKDKYTQAPIQGLQSSKKRKQLMIIKLKSVQEKKDSFESDAYPSLICASWHGPGYSVPLRKRFTILEEILRDLGKLRASNSWLPVLIGGDFNMDVKSLEIAPDFSFVPYRANSGNAFKDLKNTFIYNWDYIYVTETQVKQYHPDIFANPFVSIKIKGKNRVKLWAIIRIQRFYRAYLRRKKESSSETQSPSREEENDKEEKETEVAKEATSKKKSEESKVEAKPKDFRRKRFNELKSIHQRRKEDISL